MYRAVTNHLEKLTDKFFGNLFYVKSCVDVRYFNSMGDCEAVLTQF